MSSLERKQAHIASWPVRRALDPRFADIARRLNDVAGVMRQETTALRRDIEPLEAAVRREVATTREIASHIAARLDAAEERLASIERQLAALDERISAGSPR